MREDRTWPPSVQRIDLRTAAAAVLPLPPGLVAPRRAAPQQLGLQLERRRQAEGEGCLHADPILEGGSRDGLRTPSLSVLSSGHACGA